MPFDPETIRSLLSGEEEYTEDLRQRYGAAPVFEHALEKQRELQVVELEKDDLVGKWNELQELLKSLDAQAAQERILGQIVSMSGAGMEIPKHEVDFAGNVSLVSIYDEQELTPESLEKYFENQEVRGPFAGFTIRFIRNEDGNFIPRLTYQVATGSIDVPHMHANMYATGIVGETSLTFLEDQRKDEIGPSLNALYELCDTQMASLTNVATALVSAESFDASRIRHIAFHANKVMKSVDTEVARQVEDGLLDLIGRYISIGQPVYLETREYAQTAEDVQGMFEYYDSNGGAQSYELSGLCAGFMFLQQAIIKKGEFVGYRKNQSLHMVFTHGARNIYVPLTEIQEWE